MNLIRNTPASAKILCINYQVKVSNLNFLGIHRWVTYRCLSKRQFLTLTEAPHVPRVSVKSSSRTTRHTSSINHTGLAWSTLNDCDARSAHWLEPQHPANVCITTVRPVRSLQAPKTSHFYGREYIDWELVYFTSTWYGACLPATNGKINHTLPLEYKLRNQNMTPRADKQTWFKSLTFTVIYYFIVTACWYNTRGPLHLEPVQKPNWLIYYARAVIGNIIWIQYTRETSLVLSTVVQFSAPQAHAHIGPRQSGGLVGVSLISPNLTATQRNFP